MSGSISDLRNLGLKTERMLADVDIYHADDLRALGSVAAYARLRFRFGNRVSILALYAMEAALLDVDWRLLPDHTKRALKAEFEKSVLPSA
ncbi:TfoX/Sxy family protein [Hyphomonas sp. FCG-A18]|uniref:TfoX/Sxy family protein n=1 Tax=Hyphomonas sp. FCG-A18 TaxID=3080019 RepID=UPI002B30E95F|nr:TfoX/Sxy family protein [Hyphomonas sp. FCG-A18]